MKITKTMFGLSGACTIAALATAMAGELEVSRYTIDGGGVMRSAAGGFEMSGTAGQPDAGRFAGGAWELSGGFWHPVSPTDCDEDGFVDLAEFSFQTECLGGPTVGLAAGCECYDVDHNGVVDLRDFAKLQAEFNSP